MNGDADELLAWIAAESQRGVPASGLALADAIRRRHERAAVGVPSFGPPPGPRGGAAGGAALAPGAGRGNPGVPRAEGGRGPLLRLLPAPRGRPGGGRGMR